MLQAPLEGPRPSHGCAHPCPQELCFQSPRETWEDWENLWPSYTTPTLCCQLEARDSPLLPSSLYSASAHTQLFIASGNTPNTRPSLPFNRHRAPAHAHVAQASMHRRLPRPQPTSPSWQERELCPFIPAASGPEGSPPDDTWASGSLHP